MENLSVDLPEFDSSKFQVPDSKFQAQSSKLEIPQEKLEHFVPTDEILKKVIRNPENFKSRSKIKREAVFWNQQNFRVCRHFRKRPTFISNNQFNKEKIEEMPKQNRCRKFNRIAVR